MSSVFGFHFMHESVALEDLVHRAREIDLRVLSVIFRSTFSATLSFTLFDPSCCFKENEVL
jgi:hypothetical protein